MLNWVNTEQEVTKAFNEGYLKGLSVGIKAFDKIVKKATTPEQLALLQTFYEEFQTLVEEDGKIPNLFEKVNSSQS